MPRKGTCDGPGPPGSVRVINWRFPPLAWKGSGGGKRPLPLLASSGGRCVCCRQPGSRKPRPRSPDPSSLSLRRFKIFIKAGAECEARRGIKARQAGRGWQMKRRWLSFFRSPLGSSGKNHTERERGRARRRFRSKKPSFRKGCAEARNGVRSFSWLWEGETLPKDLGSTRSRFCTQVVSGSRHSWVRLVSRGWGESDVPKCLS